MKILVVNLLRIGDFLQAAPVVAALTRKYPVRTVDVLTFRGTERLRALTPFVGRWWTLDRDELQTGLGRADLPLLTSFDVLRETLDRISAEKYDLVINLTHSAFSGFVCHYLRADAKLGLAVDARGRPTFNSPWFEYLNAHADRPGADVRHHVDVFWRACGLTRVPKNFILARTEDGATEVDQLGFDSRPLVAVQPFTSDERKTYPAPQMIAALNQLRAREPNVRLAILAAPNERERAAELAAQTGARVAVTSMAGALALLDRARVLITGDTSVKHLACFTGAKILELSLGPSDHLRTGAFKPGAYILRSRAACAPCRHSGGCTEPRQVCADSIPPAEVAAVAHALLNGRELEIVNLAQNARARVLRTSEDDDGFWAAVDLKSAARPAFDLRSINHPPETA